MALRAAFVSNASSIGGGERCLEDLFRGMGARLTPIVFCPGEGAFPDLLNGMGIATETRTLRQPSWSSVGRVVMDTAWLRGRLRRHGASLVHANSPLWARPVALAARSLALPMICHIHYPLGEDFVRWVFRALPAPQAFVLVCDDLERQMGAMLQRHCPRTLRHVVYNGIDVDAFVPAPVPPPPERHIGIVANLQPVKGHEDFFRMAALLGSRYPHLRFHVVGDDVQRMGRRRALEELVGDLGLSGAVRFWGFVSDVRPAFEAFEILVCPSYEEAAPRCLVEAMATGRPIVATRVNGIPDMIDDNVNGLLVPAGRPDALAEAVARLLDDPGLGRSLAAAGRRRAVDRYSLAAYADGIARVYAACGVSPPHGPMDT